MQLLQFECLLWSNVGITLKYVIAIVYRVRFLCMIATRLECCRLHDAHTCIEVCGILALWYRWV